MRSIIGKAYLATVAPQLHNLRQAEFMEPEQVKALQQERLARLLSHAYQHCPYYRRILSEAGVVDSRGRVELAHFCRIPLLTKDILRKKLDELKSSDLHRRRWYYNTSGGSTGEPVRFIQDAEYRLWARAVKILFDSWTGYKVGEPKVLLWGSERDLFVGKETLRVRAIRWLKNETWLNAFRMTIDDMRRYVQIINRVRPVQILAYVESIYELARFVEREKLVVYPPKAIMTSAGTLYQEMRRVIERVFQAPVFNRYGSREVGDVACECETHEGLHVSSLTHYVEIVREDGTPAAPGEIGQVVVTSLTNYAMPFIRYSIGDTASMAAGRCSCGRSWPLLQQVYGRVTDSFVREDGGVVVPEFFIHTIGVVLYSDWIRTFQCIQEDYRVVRLRIVPAVPAQEAQRLVDSAKEKLEEMVRLVMGERCQLLIDIVDEIEPSPSGKRSYTVSRVRDRKAGEEPVG